MGCSPHFAGFHLTFTTSTSWGTRTRWMSIGAEVLSRNRRIFESKIAKWRYHWRFRRAFSHKMSPHSKNYCDFQRFLLFWNKAMKCGTFWQKCGNAGNKPKCGISRTIAGRLTPMADVWMMGIKRIEEIRNEEMRTRAGVTNISKKIVGTSGEKWRGRYTNENMEEVMQKRCYVKIHKGGRSIERRPRPHSVENENLIYPKWSKSIIQFMFSTPSFSPYISSPSSRCAAATFPAESCRWPSCRSLMSSCPVYVSLV